MGSSFGGLFTLYAMFQEPGLFTRFVAASPAVGFDNESIYNFVKTYKDPGYPARLYMAFGGLEGNVSQFKKFVDHLGAKGYKDLKMETKILENIGHSGSKAEGFTRGLQWAFERPSLSLEPAVLKQYEGAYEIRPGFNGLVTSEEGRL